MTWAWYVSETLYYILRLLNWKVQMRVSWYIDAMLMHAVSSAWHVARKYWRRLSRILCHCLLQQIPPTQLELMLASLQRDGYTAPQYEVRPWTLPNGQKIPISVWRQCTEEEFYMLKQCSLFSPHFAMIKAERCHTTQKPDRLAHRRYRTPECMEDITQIQPQVHDRQISGAAYWSDESVEPDNLALEN